MFKIIIGMMCLILAVFSGTPMMVSGEGPEDIMSLPLGKIIIEPPKSVTPEASVFPHTFPTLWL